MRDHHCTRRDERQHQRYYLQTIKWLTPQICVSCTRFLVRDMSIMIFNIITNKIYKILHLHFPPRSSSISPSMLSCFSSYHFLILLRQFFQNSFVFWESTNDISIEQRKYQQSSTSNSTKNSLKRPRNTSEKKRKH